MRLQKAISGALFAAFFFFLCQAARLFVTVWRDEAYFSCNAWGAFGLPFSPIVLFFFAAAAFAIFFFGFRQAEGFSEAWPWLMLIAAGASNLAERLMYGCVIDYVFLPHFPAFNLADVLWTVGVFALVFQAFAPDRARKSA